MSDGPTTPPGIPPESQPPGGAPPPPSDWQAPPPPSPQAQPPAAAVAGQPADLVNRFLAKLIDWIILAIVLSIAAAAGLLVSLFSGGSNFLFGVLSTVLTTALVLGYFVVCESSGKGQTLGKMALKLQVQGPDGGTPTLEQAVRRNAYVLISLVGVIPWIGGFLSSIGMLAATIFIAVTINNDTVGRKGWHDELAGGTTVVKTA